MRSLALLPLGLILLAAPVFAVHGACEDDEADDVRADLTPPPSEAALARADIRAIRSGMVDDRVEVHVTYRAPPRIDEDHTHSVDLKLRGTGNFDASLSTTTVGFFDGRTAAFPPPRVEGHEVVFVFTASDVRPEDLAGPQFQVWAEASVREGDAVASDRARCDMTPLAPGDDLGVHTMYREEAPVLPLAAVLALGVAAVARRR